MKIAILGAGKIARGVLFYLLKQDVPQTIKVVDYSQDAIKDLLRPHLPNDAIEMEQCDAASIIDLARVLSDCDIAINCLPYYFNLNATKAAIEAKCHLCDLGGNNTIVQQQFELSFQAQKAGVSILPDCGLAPGFVSLLLADACQDFDVRRASIKVGGLPATEDMAQRSGPLGYTEVFSIEGLVNEYVQPVTVLRNGKLKEVAPLSEYETLEINGQKLEAFTTSGGASTLPQTYRGSSVEDIEYKTLRYLGHHRILKALEGIEALTIDNLRTLVKPASNDIVYGQVVVRGADLKTWNRIKRTYQFVVRTLHPPMWAIGASFLSAMAQATAFPASIIALMLPHLVERGVLSQEKVIDSKHFIEKLRKEFDISIRDEITL
jgi:lysine 6-dehydrogenase